MKCPNCYSKEGSYHETESYELVEDDWGYYTYSWWVCSICNHVVYSYEEGYVDE